MIGDADEASQGPRREIWRLDVDKEDGIEDKFIIEPESAHCRYLTRGLGVEADEDKGEAEALRNEEEADGEEEAEDEESTEIESMLDSIPESVEFFRSSDLVLGQARGDDSPRCLKSSDK